MYALTPLTDRCIFHGLFSVHNCDQIMLCILQLKFIIVIAKLLGLGLG